MTPLHGVELRDVWYVPCNGVTGTRATYSSREERVDADGDTAHIEVRLCASFNRQLRGPELAREILSSRQALRARDGA